MRQITRVRVIEALAGLPRNVLQVPDGKSFFAGEHCSNTVALHIFRRGAKEPIHFFTAV